jgi:dTDP-4-dehydrorhamnose reductase
LESIAGANTLIVGIDSQISIALAEFLTNQQGNVFGTTRKKENVSDNVFYLNLADSRISLPERSFDFVVVCASVTNILECENFPKKSELVNVTNTIKLIDDCFARGGFVIYPSSNAVFDGSKAFNRHDDEPRPNSMYGRFKLAVEKHVINNAHGNAAVLRFTKIMTNRSPLFQGWHEDANKGREIRAYGDKFFSPLAMEDAVDAIFTVMKKQRSGVFQLGGRDEVSYFDYARALFASDPAKLALIHSINQPEPKPYFNHHNSLARWLPD